MIRDAVLAWLTVGALITFAAGVVAFLMNQVDLPDKRRDS